MGTIKRKSFPKYPGVRAIIKENGDTVYYIRYKDPFSGKLYEEKIGSHSEGITANIAFQIRQQRLAKLRLGEEVETLKEKRKKQIRLSDFFYQIYLPSAKANKKPETIQREISKFKNWIEPVIGDLPIGKISQIHIEKIKITMKEANKAPRTIQHTLAILRHIIYQAQKLGFFKGENPAKGNYPIPDNKRLRFLTPSEAQALLKALKKKNQTTYEMALLALHCGLRFGEIANLRWADIDTDLELIAIRDPKNKTSRWVPMTPTIKKLFVSKTKGDAEDFVFKDKKGRPFKYVPDSFRDTVQELGLNEGIKDRRFKITFHSLRHTYASWLVQSGVPLYTVQQLLGHKTPIMTQRYSHLSMETQKEAVKSIEDVIQNTSAEIIQLNSKAE